MPYGDRTGPMGQGPMTGRALGFCAGYDSPGYTKGFGRGMGRGFGFGGGRGRGRGFRGGWGFGRSHNPEWPYYTGSYPAPWPESLSKEDEIKMLKSEAQALKRSQSEIEKRLKELEDKGSDK